LYGHQAFAYVVCDPVRRGKEISKKIVELESAKDELDLEGSGVMILVSNIDMNINEIVPLNL